MKVPTECKRNIGEGCTRGGDGRSSPPSPTTDKLPLLHNDARHQGEADQLKYKKNIARRRTHSRRGCSCSLLPLTNASTSCTMPVRHRGAVVSPKRKKYSSCTGFQDLRILYSSHQSRRCSSGHFHQGHQRQEMFTTTCQTLSSLCDHHSRQEIRVTMEAPTQCQDN